MSVSKYTRNCSTSNLDGHVISRRVFLQNMAAFSMAALVGSNLLEGCNPSTVVAPTTAPTAPSPEKPNEAAATASLATTVSEALKKRKSTDVFQPQPLPKETLLELLWAAWGINRLDSGKRTAPSAMNAQEIDIYVLLAEGVFMYDAKGNQLTHLSDQDLRTKAANMGFAKDAPVHLLFVADYAKLGKLPQPQKEQFSAAHTGFIGQNVYLYCASTGLGAHFYASITDRAALKKSLKLRENQAILFAQVVGYPKE